MLESTRIDDRETFLKLPYSKSKHLPNKSNVNILTSIKFSHRDSDGLHIFTYLLPSNQQMYPPFVTHQYLVSIPTQLQDHHYSAYNTRGDVAYRLVKWQCFIRLYTDCILSDPVSSFIEFRTHLFTFFSESHCSRDEILVFLHSNTYTYIFTYLRIFLNRRSVGEKNSLRSMALSRTLRRLSSHSSNTGPTPILYRH